MIKCGAKVNDNSKKLDSQKKRKGKEKKLYELHDT